MITTKQKDLKDILKMLEGKERVFLIGCGDCAATCKTGGEEDVRRVAVFLEESGKKVTGMVVPDVACVSAQVKIAFAKNREAMRSSDAVVVFACGSGVQCVKENDRLGLDIYPGCDSLFAALIDKDGRFREVCAMCGECLLDVTEGICPVARCPKGLLNGPCGGQTRGKCETDRTRDCAWVLIYKRLKDKGRLDRLRKRQPAKDRQKAARPGALSL